MNENLKTENFKGKKLKENPECQKTVTNFETTQKNSGKMEKQWEKLLQG